MPFSITCDICKDTKAIEEYGGRIVLWEFHRDFMYSAKACDNCMSRFMTALRQTVRNPEYDKQFLDYFGVKI